MENLGDDDQRDHKKTVTPLKDNTTSYEQQNSSNESSDIIQLKTLILIKEVRDDLKDLNKKNRQRYCLR